MEVVAAGLQPREELRMLEVAQHVRIESMEIARRLPNEVIRQRVTMEIDRILQNMPDCLVKHPTTARRLNWVGVMENLKKLEVYKDGIHDRFKVFERAHEDIIGMIRREFSQNRR